MIINIEEHFGLVHSCCRRFASRGIEYDDLFQAGCMGLAKAAKKFDAERGLQFSTYAVPVILGEIKTLFRDGGAIKISRSIKELATKVKIECERFIEIYEREPTVSELADLLEVDGFKIIEALDSVKIPMSLSADSESDDTRETVIAVPFDEENISSRIAVSQVMKTFEKRDKILIYLRFFSGITQSQIAKKLGMTQVQVSRREKLLIKILRDRLSN